MYKLSNPESCLKGQKKLGNNFPDNFPDNLWTLVEFYAQCMDHFVDAKAYLREQSSLPEWLNQCEVTPATHDPMLAAVQRLVHNSTRGVQSAPADTALPWLLSERSILFKSGTFESMQRSVSRAWDFLRQTDLGWMLIR